MKETILYVKVAQLPNKNDIFDKRLFRTLVEL